ncbi:MAG: addiction module antidote protein [Desulfatirhabdiaceae bacterium]
MALRTRLFDIAEHETDEDIKFFLQDAAESTPEEFIHEINTAARAKGMTEIAKKAGVTRASLYKSLSDPGDWHGQHQSVERGMVEAFTDQASDCKKHVRSRRIQLAKR